jgi:hypothetical protein
MDFYTTKRKDASETDLEVSIDCFGVDFQGNFFKRNLTIYVQNHHAIFRILNRWNLQGGEYKLIEGFFAPIHFYKLAEIKLNKEI